MQKLKTVDYTVATGKGKRARGRSLRGGLSREKGQKKALYISPSDRLDPRKVS